MIMKQIVLFALMCCMSSATLCAQGTTAGVYAVEENPIVAPKPLVRNIVGGTLINVNYVGSGINDTFKGAFERACKIWEENIPTTLPIKLNVAIGRTTDPWFRDQSCLAYVNTMSSENGYGDKVEEKRIVCVSGSYDQNEMSLAYIRDDADATITFCPRVTNRGLFSYELESNECDPGKYDFVTVALQAICKAVGFVFKGSVVGNQLVPMEQTNTYTKKICVEHDLGDATSGNLSIETDNPSNGKDYTLPIYSPMVFDGKFSLGYFDRDSENIETAFMQPGVAKGSVIRYIGDTMQGFFCLCDWNLGIATGMGSSSSSGSSTSDVIAYQGPKSVSGKNKVPLQEIPYEEQNEVSDYIENHLEFAGGEKSVLMGDGSWKAFSTYGDLSTEQNYARTSDGYLRIKEVTLNPGVGGQYYNCFVNYRLYDFPPQKPEASMNGYSTSALSVNALRRSNTVFVPTADDEFVDVEIGFKNTEGCDEILVEQTDADYPVPYTYFVDPNDGSFIAFMNKRYPSTFRLTYYNDNGEVIGDPLTIDLTDETTLASSSLVRLRLVGNNLLFKIDQTYSEQAPRPFTIQCVANTAYVRKGSISGCEGSIDVTGLPSGVYTFSTTVEGKSCTVKWTK